MNARKTPSAGHASPPAHAVADRLASRPAASAGLVLPRERLHALIDARLPGAVWLHGPTGAGKTVLLRSYLQQAGCAALWLSADERHRDPAALFAAVSAAAEPRCAAFLPVFSPEHRADPEAFADDYFDRLDRLLASDVAIVVDDAHHLVGATAPLLAAAIDRFDGRRRLCFASQLMPDASFAPQLAGSRLWIVGHKALAFDVDEAQGLAHRIGSGATTLEALVDATDGWAAGLMLAMQFGASGGSDSGSEDPLETVRTPLAMLIAGQVLGGVAVDDIARLRLLAELPQVPVDLADIAPEWASACARLQGLADRGLFVERLVNDRSRRRTATHPASLEPARAAKGCWRLHDLFRSTLREVVGYDASTKARADALIASLLRVDRLDLAWQLASRVDRDLFQSLVSSHGGEAFDHQEVLSMLQLARPHAHRGAPYIAIWLARGLIGNDNVASLCACEEAYVGFDAMENGHGRALAASLALFVIFATTENVGEKALWVDRFAEVDRMSLHRLDRREDQAIRVAAEVVHDFMIGRRANEQTPYEMLQDWLLQHVSTQVLSANEMVLAGSLLVVAMCRLMRFNDVEVVILQIEGTSSYQRAAPHIRASWNVESGHHFTRVGAADRARTHFDEALALSDANALLQPRIDALIGLARLELSVGDAPCARRHIESLDTLGTARLGRQQGWVVHLHARLEAFSHRYQNASARVDQAERLILDAGFPALAKAIFDQDRIQLRYASGEVDESLSLATTLICSSPPIDAQRLEIVRGLLDAHGSWRSNRDRARSLLETHLTKAATINYVAFVSLLPTVAAEIVGYGLQCPIDREFLVRVVRHRRLPAPGGAPAQWPWQVRVEVLKDFRIVRDGEPLLSTGKAQKKPLELLKYLVCTPGLIGDAASLCAALWPDDDDTASRKSLEVTVSRLRKLLGDDALLIVREGKVSLDRRSVSSDAREFIEVGIACESVIAGRIAGRHTLDLQERLLALFHGLPLEHEESSRWREAVRERFRTTFVRAARTLIVYWQEAGEASKAMALLEAALAREPLAEGFYRMLMQIHLDAGQPNEAMRVYRQCRQMLSVLIGARPATETERLKDSINP